MNQLQKIILNIFKEIKKICEKHNIRYFAIGGTCIGAVRHKGFIPWDDDIDIAIPNSDYEKFLSFAKLELPPNLKVCDVSKDTKHGLDIIARVYDINTTLVSKGNVQYYDTYIGVHVDVMPIYGLPNNKIILFFYIITAKLIRQFIYFQRRGNQNYNETYKRIIVYLLYKLLKPFTKHIDWFNIWRHLLAIYDFDKSEHTGYTWWSLSKELMFPRCWFDKTVLLKFEDTSIACPYEYHKYLSNQFGDYMRLPPKTEQIPKLDGIIDIYKSYTCYMAKD